MPPTLRHVPLRQCRPRRLRQCRNFSHGVSRANIDWDQREDVDKQWAPEQPSNSDDRVPIHMTRRAFSGIQPTGIPHLGNYLGALRQWKRLHDQSTDPKFARDYTYQQYFSVVDLHALTADTPAPERLRLRKESFAALLAIGLHNTRETTVFFQSDVMAHSSLMWILSTIASTGYLSRMTQWKSKLNLPDDANLDSDEATAKLKLGLFSYPVLQAADILLYRPSIVPVGQDQAQHIEFTRVLARSFNSLVRDSWGGDVFRVPWPVISPAKKIMSLKRPTQKMSKSDPDPKSRILITDSPEEIHAKIKGAVTDSEPGISFDPEQRPGVSNLVEILKHVTESGLPSQFIAKDHANLSMRAFKELVADEIIFALRGIRQNFMDIMQPENSELHEEVYKGAMKARRKAAATLRDVKDALGLHPLILPEGQTTRRRVSSSRDEMDPETEVNPWENEGVEEQVPDFLKEDGGKGDGFEDGGKPQERPD